MLGRKIYDVLSSKRFDGLFTKTHLHCQWQQPDRVGLILGKTIWIGILEFTADRFGNLSLSPEGNDSGAVFIGMVHNGPPSVHTIHEESSDEGDTTSGGEGALDSLTLEGAMW
jgi:hypothetical protein